MPFIEPVIRSSIVLALGLLVSMCLANRSAALRHRLLAAALLASALVFPLSVTLPEWRVTLPARTVAPPPEITTPPAELVHSIRALPQPQPPTSTFRSTSRIRFVWLSGLFIAGSTLIAGLVRVSRAAARGRLVEDPRWLAILDSIARRYGLRRRIGICRTDSADLLATWGLLRPQVLVPDHSRTWTVERVHIVLGHELAHIRRRDWAVQICAETLRAIFWFNPLVWMICRRLRSESEQACDDEVLGLGVDGRDYAAHLLELARQCRRTGSSWASAVPIAHPSTLERRIAAMLNPQLNRRVPSRSTIATLCVALVLVALPVAALRARQAAPPAPSALTHDVSGGASLQADVKPKQVKPTVNADAPPHIVRVTPRAPGSPGRRSASAPLTGTIYDVSGGVLPGVQVTLIDANENTWTATSNASGRFELPSVSEGRYVLAVTLAGFRALRQDFELRNARDWDRAITLQVGELQETITVRGSRVSAPEPSVALNQPVRIGGNVRAPTKVRDVRPVYPAAMREAGLTGDVPIEAIIGRDGTVSSVRVLSAQVHPDFAIAAVDAVRQWRFSPTLLNGVPVEVVMRVSVRFDLD
jgi:TonB family protein